LKQSVIKQINSRSNSLHYYVPVKLVSLQTQVVAGINYLMELKVAESNCLKNVSY
uniref:Cystatin domain-containing protein n=1 Tax=Dracunculus medinensis TaxID=318479 RepID=A0A0N4U0D3_DRAME